MIKLLLDHGANIDQYDADARTPLISACLNGQHSIADYLIDIGADIKATGKGKYTALHCAAETNEGIRFC